MSHPVYAASKSPSTLRHKVMFVLLVDRHFAGSCRPLLALTICHLSRAGGRLSTDSRPANPSNRRRTRSAILPSGTGVIASSRALARLRNAENGLEKMSDAPARRQ